MVLTERLVSIAKEKLESQPFDGVHNLDHHAKVWANCEEILEKDKPKDLDRDVLRVACWWHDVERGDRGNKELEGALQELGADPEFAQKVTKTVDEHTFGANQTCSESQVLYDADKLEYLSVGRFKDLMRMGDEKKRHYFLAWQERIKAVWENLHFTSAREEFVRRFKRISRFAEDYPVLLQAVQECGLDFSQKVESAD